MEKEDNDEGCNSINYSIIKISLNGIGTDEFLHHFKPPLLLHYVGMYLKMRDDVC